MNIYSYRRHTTLFLSSLLITNGVILHPHTMTKNIENYQYTQRICHIFTMVNTSVYVTNIRYAYIFICTKVNTCSICRQYTLRICHLFTQVNTHVHTMSPIYECVYIHLFAILIFANIITTYTYMFNISNESSHCSYTTRILVT
jgi:hypothetical protein